MKKVSEGKKMFISVMIIFAVYAVIFILFEDYDRTILQPFAEPSDWHLLLFSLLVMIGLAFLLHRYAVRMDQRISKEQSEKHSIMRRELTQNIAHELKTPVSSILGFTDTIIDNPDLSKEQMLLFINKTNQQAKRLTNLLKDISTLNRIDYASDMIEMKTTDVNKVVVEIINEVYLQCESKNISIKNCLPSGIMVKGNYTLIYSIFRNLFDNAINYSGNDTVIELSAQDDLKMWHFVFEDNGIGVLKEHLSRLFERFYRIDNGRMRTVGGTGLGLAIVKNAVILHGGNIAVYHNEPSGLRFEFSLKKVNS